MLGSETYLTVIPQFVTGGAALVAGIIDVSAYRIPNVLTFSLCLSGLLYHLAVAGGEGLLYSFLGAAAGLLILLWFYVMGAMGAGDVKLLAGVGAWLGAEATFYVFLVAGVASGLYSLGVLASSGRLRTAWSTLAVWFIQLQTLGKHLGRQDRIEVLREGSDRRRRLIPFALMVTVGVVVVFLGGYHQGMLVLK